MLELWNATILYFFIDFMKVLIVRLKQIGDSVLALPVCNTLRKSAPNAQIHFMVYQHIAPLFENHRSIDKIVRMTPQQRNSKKAFLSLLSSIRAQRYDAVLDIINTPTSLIITRFSGASIQAGFANKKIRTRFYRTKIPHLGEGAGRRKVPVLEALNIPLDYDYTIDINLPDNERALMKSALVAAGISPQKPLIAMMVYSRRDYKIWPADYFVKLSDHLIEAYGAQLYFVYGPGEEDAVKEIAAKVRHNDNVFTQPQAPSTRDLACLLSCVDFFIGNDGGPRHIAQAVGTSTFSIFSPLISKSGWIPNYPDPQHQAIDITDVGDISHKDREFLKNNLKDYYLKIKPEIVIERIDAMLKDKPKFLMENKI